MQRGFCVLLLLFPAALADLPFYCRFRKPNCALRPNTKCCPPAVVAEDTTLSATTISPENEAATIAGAVNGAVVSQGDLVGALVSQGDLLEELRGEEVDGAQNTTSDGDEDLQAEPSQIREVIVEAPEINQIATTSEKPEKYAPRFCLVLKYNCKSRSSHPCCRHPLPPRNPPPISVPARKASKVRPTRKSIPKRPVGRPPLRRGGSAAPEEEEVTTQRSRRPRPTLRNPPTTAAAPKISNTPRRSSLRRPRPPRPTWQTTARPRPRPRPTRQRPRFGSGKSPVCRIINCKRNPAHKCCQEPTTTTTTTTEAEDTTLDPLLTSTTPVSLTDAPEVVGDTIVSHVASVSTVETRLVAATSPRRENASEEEINEDEQQLLGDFEQEQYMESEDEMTTMSYTELEQATPRQDDAPALDMMYETTLRPQATDDVVELNPVESGGGIINEIQQPSPDFVDTIIHIGDSGGSFFQEVAAVSTTLTPPQDVVNNFSYEKMDEEGEEKEIEKMGSLAPLYVEAKSPEDEYDEETPQVTIVYPTPPGQEWEEPASPVFIPHPVFVPERGEKDRIRQEVEQRIVEEERRLEEEERRRKELEEVRRIEELEEVRRIEENEARLIQEEERRRQEVEYWRQQVQEEEERRRQEQELRIKQQEKQEEDQEEEVLVLAASSRDARLALGNLVLGEEGLEARKESVELPPRVRMECFRFDCLSAPSDPCCSRSKRQIANYDVAPAFKTFVEEKQFSTGRLFDEEEEPSSLQTLHHLPLRRPLLPGWRVEATVTRVEKSVHWGEK